MCLVAEMSFFNISCKSLIYLKHLHPISKKQCGECTLLSEYIKKLLSTMKTFILLTDKTADETVTIVFGCVLPIMLAVLFISMTCYCVHRYIHVRKQKHPTNLVSLLCCRRSLPTLALTGELYVFQGSESAERKPCLAANKSPSCYSDQEKSIT